MHLSSLIRLGCYPVFGRRQPWHAGMTGQRAVPNVSYAAAVRVLLGLRDMKRCKKAKPLCP